MLQNIKPGFYPKPNIYKAFTFFLHEISLFTIKKGNFLPSPSFKT